MQCKFERFQEPRICLQEKTPNFFEAQYAKIILYKNAKNFNKKQMQCWAKFI